MLRHDIRTHPSLGCDATKAYKRPVTFTVTCRIKHCRASWRVEGGLSAGHVVAASMTLHRKLLQQ